MLLYKLMVKRKGKDLKTKILKTCKYKRKLSFSTLSCLSITYKLKFGEVSLPPQKRTK